MGIPEVGIVIMVIQKVECAMAIVYIFKSNASDCRHDGEAFHPL